MAELVAHSENISTCTAVNVNISQGLECQNCIVMEEQLKEDLAKLLSAQLSTTGRIE
jgi:hypothetical protein